MRSFPIKLGVIALFAVACRDTQAPPAPGPGSLGITQIDTITTTGHTGVVMTPAAAPPSTAIAAAQRERGATSPAGAAALWHVDHHASRWQLSAPALASVEVAHVHDTGRGAIVVSLRQRVGGLEVVRTRAAVIMDRNLGLVALSGQLATFDGPPVATTMAMTGRRALELAAGDVTGVTPTFSSIAPRAGYQRFAAPDVTTARAREVLVVERGHLVRAWQTELGLRQQRKIVGARHVHTDDGRLVYRQSLTDDATFAYRVWADTTGDHLFQGGPLGDVTPHPTGVPDGFDPPFVAPALISIDGFNAPGDPWLSAGATETRGNNVDAYADKDFIDGFSAGDLRATTTAPGVFDRTYDPTQQPDASPDQIQAAVTHLFYVNNWLHDYFYDSGFTEAAGNAQASNFGRGGTGGDELHAEGQDASGTDNANMFTPGDGESPVMQMFIFSAPPGGPRRDGTIDSPIIAHEWGHYLHHRLVDCGSRECSSMSEGWGDLIAMLTSLRSDDDLAGTWSNGAYAIRSFTDNSVYFGIRRYPYSTDFTKNPLTLRMVRSGEPLPGGPAFSDIDFLQGSDNWEVHNSGEVWCAMLWQGLIELVQENRVPFAEAQRRYADYLVGGMIAAPVEPSYTEQRDAILAVAAASDLQDFVTLATAYAKRGFGGGAVAPPINSFNGAGVVEDFDVRGAFAISSLELAEDAVSCDADGFLDAGETGTVTITVRNTGAGTLAAPTVTVSTPTAGARVVGPATQQLASLASFETATATFAVRLDEVAATPHSVRFDVALADANAGASVTQAVAGFANIDITPASSKLDRFEDTDLAWTVSPGGFARESDPTSSHVAAVSVVASGDHTMLSPALDVGAGQNLTLVFNHRHSFGTGDGGVIEVSTDGVDFVDVASLATSPYNGTIAGTDNPLDGRAGFRSRNASHPALDQVALDLGSGFGGQTVFLRFRAGGDATSDVSRWEIDDVLVGGITNTPFPLFGFENGPCLPGARPIADAGTAVSVASGAAGALDGTASVDPDGGALTFEWQQRSGPVLALSSSSVAQPTFTAPTTQNTLTARFQLVVRDPDARVSEPSFVDVTIVGAEPVDGAVDGAPDAAPEVDAPPMDVDAPPMMMPDAGGNGFDDEGGGGCCQTGRQPTTGGVLVALVVLARLGRRRNRRSR